MLHVTMFNETDFMHNERQRGELTIRGRHHRTAVVIDPSINDQIFVEWNESPSGRARVYFFASHCNKSVLSTDVCESLPYSHFPDLSIDDEGVAWDLRDNGLWRIHFVTTAKTEKIKMIIYCYFPKKIALQLLQLKWAYQKPR